MAWGCCFLDHAYAETLLTRQKNHLTKSLSGHSITKWEPLCVINKHLHLNRSGLNATKLEKVTL